MSNVCELYSSIEYIKYILNNLVLTELVAQFIKFAERHWVARLIKVDVEKLSWLKCSTVRKEKCFPACEKLSSSLFKCIGQEIDCRIGEVTRCLIYTHKALFQEHRLQTGPFLLQSCLPGYYRVDGILFGGICQPCECHGHASECDIHGICSVSLLLTCASLTLTCLLPRVVSSGPRAQL